MSYTPSYLPEGCAATKAAPAFIMGAGVHWEKAYQFAEEKKITIVGGVCASVGGGGKSSRYCVVTYFYVAFCR